MRKHLSQKKQYLLLAGTFLFVLISYQLAFKGTLAAWQTRGQLTAQLSRAADLAYQPGYLQRKNDNLEKVIRLYKADTVAFRSNSISRIAALAEKEKVKLSEVPIQDPFYHTGQFILQKLGFEGDFFALTRVLHQLQSTSGIGIIRSASYKVTGNSQNPAGDHKLVLEVYLEIAR
jgi:hypothetical protein